MLPHSNRNEAREITLLIANVTGENEPSTSKCAFLFAHLVLPLKKKQKRKIFVRSSLNYVYSNYVEQNRRFDNYPDWLIGSLIFKVLTSNWIANFLKKNMPTTTLRTNGCMVWMVKWCVKIEIWHGLYDWLEHYFFLWISMKNSSRICKEQTMKWVCVYASWYDNTILPAMFWIIDSFIEAIQFSSFFLLRDVQPKNWLENFTMSKISSSWVNLKCIEQRRSSRSSKYLFNLTYSIAIERSE